MLNSGVKLMRGFTRIKLFNTRLTNRNAAQLNETNNIKSPDYFVKNDPDVFGSLATPAKHLLVETTDAGDKLEDEHLENPPDHKRKLSTKQYADLIKGFVRNRKIKEAIDVLEIRMKSDAVKPDNYLFNLVIGACGRVGYTKKAFSLYNDLKRRGLKPTAGTYTALFNACANSPWTEDGIMRAKNLRHSLNEKGVQLNDTNYNALIKAFGRCGDISGAFAIVDEMIADGLPVNENTINFLLQSCITDKDTGFRHSLFVWRKFHEKHIRPNIFSYNLLLRCVRDCSVGDITSNDTPNLKITGDVEGSSILPYEENALVPTVDLELILRQRTRYPADRLALIGGCEGLLASMRECNVKPDVKTFTFLMECAEGNLEGENKIVEMMKRFKVRPDIEFLNALMKKRCLRKDYENAKEVIKMFDSFKLRPNIFTYGISAMVCRTKEEADNLLQDMQRHNYRLNIEILGALLRQACVNCHFGHVLELMETASRERIGLNRKFLSHLEKFRQYCVEHEAKTRSEPFKKGAQIFKLRYSSWLEEVKPLVIQEEHPWTQFRQPTLTNTKHYRDTQTHYKPRVTSKFRVKTVNK